MRTLLHFIYFGIFPVSAVALTALLSGCGQRAAELVWPDMATLEPIAELRTVDAAIWERPAIAYSGFREGQNPNNGLLPSDAEVLEDLRLLAGRGFGLLRVYSAGAHGAQVVNLIAAHGLDLKVQLGAYLSGAHASHGDGNLRELDAAIAMANAHPDIVMAVSVGNEVLVSWSFVPVPPADMIAYIHYVRGQIRQPVTVNDNWEPFAAAADSGIAKVWGQIDYVSLHTYPYWDAGYNLWEWRPYAVDGAASNLTQLIAQATAYAQRNFLDARRALDAANIRIPIVIGETGWQNLPSAVLDGAPSQDFASKLASPAAQRQYFKAMQTWIYGSDLNTPGDGFARPSALFYFSAFDEPWKQADDNWGLWDVRRQPKPALH